MNARLSLSRPAFRRVQKPDGRGTMPISAPRGRVVLKMAVGRSGNAASREPGCASSSSG